VRSKVARALDKMSGKEPHITTRMKDAWLNEKNSPEILQFESDLVSTLLAQIENQQQYFNETVSNQNEQFQSHLYEMEAERIKYVIRCYLRTRIAKIEKHFLYILQNEEIYSKLSEQELTYAQKYCDTVQSHLDKTVLHSLPENLRSLTEQTADFDMIPKPNLDEFVFCKVLQNIGDYQLDEVDSVRLEEDDIYLLRFRAIKPLLEAGKIRLL